MSGEFHVDPGVLDGIASTLRNVSADVDALGDSIPGIPDAGDGTPAIAGILARLVDNAGQFVVGAAAAAEAVAETNSDYQGIDVQMRDDLRRSPGER